MSATTRPRKGSPVVIENAAGKVKIYATGAAYTLSWTAGGERRREKRATLEAARERARGILGDLRSGAGHVRSFTIQQTAAIDAAVEALREIHVPLSSAVRDYAEAHKLLEGRASVVEAARAYLRHLDEHECRPALVKDVAAEFLASVEKRNLSARYRRDCDLHVGKLKAAAGTRSISELRAAELDRIIEKSTRGGPRAFNNVRGTLGAFFAFAQRRGYLPRDRTHEVALVEPREERAGGLIAIYQPEELARLLKAADARLRPFLALGGLAGLRSAEICRLTWEMIDLDRGHILLGKEFTKTRRRRVVPVCPALAAWLRPLRDEGRVYEFDDSSSLNRMAVRHWPRDREGNPLVERRPNALRHSFGTYRFALLQDEQKVSSEMGNSPQELREHYAELATPDQAKAWFDIAPRSKPHLRLVKEPADVRSRATKPSRKSPHTESVRGSARA